MNNIFKYIAIIFLLFTACDNSKDLEALKSDLEKTIEETTTAIKEMTKDSDKIDDLASEEVEKLFNYEYTVKDYDSSLSAEEFEVNLKALGKDRWICFHIEKEIKYYRVFCRRRPKTYLRYLPRFIS